MAPHKLVSFATIKALSTLVTLLIKLIRILLKWKCIQGKIIAKAKLICQKSFVPVTGLKCSYGKIFIPVAEISVVETEISVTGLACLLIYEHIEIFTKEIGVRRALGNRASPVNRALMKRP